MRISNIKQYLGGADNVIARDIIEGDQFTFNFKIGSENLTNYTFEVDTQLFTSSVTSTGSNITINSLDPITPVVINETQTFARPGGTSTSSSAPAFISGIANAISPDSLEVNNNLTLNVSSALFPSFTRIDDNTFPSAFGEYSLRTVNGVIQLLHRTQSGVAGTTDDITVTLTGTKTFTKGYEAGDATTTGQVIKAVNNLSADLRIPSSLLSDLDPLTHGLANSTTPPVIVMSVTTNDGAAFPSKRTFRLLWIVRYRPIVNSN